MTGWPATISTEEELDALLARPSEGLVDFMKDLEGDLLVLGAGGKVGHTLVDVARNAIAAAGTATTITAVDCVPMPVVEAMGVNTITCDLLDTQAVAALPDVENIVFMAGRKFGSSGAEHLTWAINVAVPWTVARRFLRSNIVAFSTGCVYPIVHVEEGGSTEESPPDPIGEYAQSCLGRERMFEYVSREQGLKVLFFRLNYAIELRYGVLFDIGQKVWNDEPVDLTQGHFNVIWQGDACEQALRSLALAASPPRILNVTGPETVSVRETAMRFGELLGKEAHITGEENGMAYLSDASVATSLFGEPRVSPDRVIEWIAHWLKIGGSSLDKPTHFETQDGKY